MIWPSTYCGQTLRQNAHFMMQYEIKINYLFKSNVQNSQYKKVLLLREGLHPLIGSALWVQNSDDHIDVTL